MNDYRSYLYHSGVKGMKWGERRYQNEDGTLTPEGIERYRKKVDKLNKKIEKNERKIPKYEKRSAKNLKESGKQHFLPGQYTKTYLKRSGKFKLKALKLEKKNTKYSKKIAKYESLLSKRPVSSLDQSSINAGKKYVEG